MRQLTTHYTKGRNMQQAVIGAIEISEEEFFNSLTPQHIRVVDLGSSAFHSDGNTMLFESISGRYAKVSES